MANFRPKTNDSIQGNDRIVVRGDWQEDIVPKGRGSKPSVRRTTPVRNGHALNGKYPTAAVEDTGFRAVKVKKVVRTPRQNRLKKQSTTRVGRILYTRKNSKGEGIPASHGRGGQRTGIRNGEKLNKSEFLQLLGDCYGHLSLACKEYGISTTSIRNARHKDENFNEAVVFIMTQCRAGILDDAREGAAAVRLEAQTLLMSLLRQGVLQDRDGELSTREIIELLKVSMDWVNGPRNTSVNINNTNASIIPQSRPDITVKVQDVVDCKAVEQDTEVRPMKRIGTSSTIREVVEEATA